ncbi:discoidin domain-containing protein [Thomasclavelia cocleata]|uniref:discoidin domain-containing protein n=2 Tax=Thomasclavelia cocleata TaxID=69824 RepID=UPI002494729D|nr:discoidin domain-containing protein [Thomasclavelia cocleata]
MKRKFVKKAGIMTITAAMTLTSVFSLSMLKVNAEEIDTSEHVLGSVSDVTQDGNKVYITYEGGEETKITFLEDNLFRFNMDPDGDFSDTPEPRSNSHKGVITQQSDESNEYKKPTPNVSEGDTITVSTDKVELQIDKETAKMKLINKENNKVVWQEKEPLKYVRAHIFDYDDPYFMKDWYQDEYTDGSYTIQTLENNNAQYFGGGTQNGRFNHTGKTINIANESSWTDGGVASPNPFYWTTAGYGVMRNTWRAGSYDFGNTKSDETTTLHNEDRFDAYYFVDDTPTELLQDYYKITGNPVLFPESAFYLGHLNCYNRDAWKQNDSGKWLLEDGKRYTETNREGAVLAGETLETLNGTNDDDYKFSARAVVDGYVDNDMPFGWFLPNDGYGCGYGQSDDSVTGIDDNVENLKQFTEYANKYGVGTGLWTQSNLTPVAGTAPHLQRDFEKEVNNGGIRTLKTDVAWVGWGYSMALSGLDKAYDILSKTGDRGTIITLDGWAGTQRYGGIWTGDQTGGNWEYIRFHIPTYIGQGLSGNPNVGSDMDGIFGGSSLITTRDYQWKTFTPLMLNMDGWGDHAKKPYVFGEDTTSINRMYLKLKSELMPYIYTTANEAVTGLPMIRAMFLEYPDDPIAYDENSVRYQYMFGKNFLVAPVYQDTNMDEHGNDIRNGIYLPDENQVWIDYFTGKQYRGGSFLNNFDTPLWKLPLFVKNGAIVPMYDENNNVAPITESNPKGLDKTKRIIEFWPEGKTSYELFEDDGITIDYSNKEEVNYGSSVSTKFTSEVKGDEAILRAEASKGTYQGYDSDRDTTFVVNVSKAPESVTGKVGSANAEFHAVDSKEAFDNATGNVYYYDETPNLNKYATEGSEFANVEITSTPKLYVKIENTDVNKNAIEVTVKGFENKQDLAGNQETDTLTAPTGLATLEDQITPTEIPLVWDAVENATEYQLEIDGKINSGITTNEFLVGNLEYNSTHTFRVRAVNSDGYSPWSETLTAKTIEDPYRNIPAGMEVTTNDSAAGYSAKNLVDRDTNAYWFTNWTDDSVNNRDKVIDFDYKEITSMDHVDIYPHSSYLNQQPREVSILGSLDGTNYTTVVDKIQLSSDSSVKSIALNGAKMRYMKMVISKPAGTYVCMTEIMPYKVDGSKTYPVGDVTLDGKVDSNDLTWIENYTGLTNKDSDFSYVSQTNNADINGDNVIDAYDISYITTKLDGGTNKTGNPDGKIMLIADKNEVKAGETVNITLLGIGLKNINAFSEVLPIDTENFSYEGYRQSYDVIDMMTIAKMRARANGSELTIVSTNVGNQDLVNGTMKLGTVTLKAKTDTTFVLTNGIAKLVGPKLSYVDADIDGDTTIPETPSQIEKAVEVKGTTITNNAYPTDDGTNVEKLIQQNSFDTLYNGVADDEFELKWDTADNQVDGVLKPEISLPVNLHLDIDGQLMNIVRVYGRPTGNGAPRVVSANVVTTDGTTIDLGTIGNHSLESNGNPIYSNYPSDGIFTFELDEAVEVKTVNITFEHATGTAGDSNNPYDRMLTLREIECLYAQDIPVTSIELDKDNRDTLYVGNLTNFNAKVSPEDALNPYYTVTSDNEDVVKVLTIKTASGFAFMLQPLKEGTANITATSVDNNTISVTQTVTVKVGTDTNALIDVLNGAEALNKDFYTIDSYTILLNAVNEAKELLSNDPTQDQVDQLVSKIKRAINGLELRPVNSNNRIEGITIADSSGQASWSENASNILDDDTGTYWLTPQTGMPQWVVVDLGSVYNLTDVTFLPRQGGNNGDIIKAAISVSTDGQNYTDLGQFEFDNDGTKLLDKTVFKQMKFIPTDARYVKVTILETLGNPANSCVSAAEMRFYGNVDVDKSELQELYNEYLTLNEANYTTESWVTFANAMADTKVVLDRADATQEEVNNIKTILQNAKNALVEVVIKTNKTALAIAIEMAENASLENVVPAVVEEFNAALENAQTVYANDNATQEEVDNAFTRLANAMHMLEFFKGNKELLQKQVDQINELESNKYIESTWSAMLPVLEKANEVLGNENAMQEEVDEVYSELVRAFINLRLKPNKDLLQDLINKANGLNRANYTSASLKAVDAEVEKASTVLNNPEATKEEVEVAVSALTKALAGLEAKPVETVKPGDTTVSVKTGDDNVIGTTVALMTLSLAGYYISKKRKS